MFWKRSLEITVKRMIKIRETTNDSYGFHIVEFFNSHHPDPNDPDERDIPVDDQFPDGMFRFEKRL